MAVPSGLFKQYSAAAFTADSSTTVSQINAWLAAPALNNGRHRLQGTLTINAPIVIPSNRFLDARGATITLAPGSECSVMRNANAVTPQRTVTDVATTSGSTTVTSAAANFTSGDVGRTLVVVGAGGNGLGPLVGIILSVTNSTTVVLSEPATATVTGATGRVFIRDTNITVLGGSWDKGNNTGIGADLGTDYHGLLFRHVDNIKVNIDKWSSTSGKYGIALGDVRHYEASVYDANCSSDLVHISGPALYGHVPYVAGTSADDPLSVTAADYPGHQDVAGDIIGLTIGTVFPTGTGNARSLAICAGAGRRIDQIKCDYIGGAPATYGVWLGDDVTQASTTGGTYGTIDLGTIAVQKTIYADLHLVSPNADRIIANIIHDSAAGAAVGSIVSDGTSTATIGALILNDCEWTNPALTNVIALTSTTTTINRLQINRPHYVGSSSLLVLTGGTVNKVVARDGEWAYSGTIGVFTINSASGAVLSRLIVDHCFGTYAGANGYLTQQLNGTLGALTVIGGEHIGGSAICRNTGGGVFPTKVTFDGGTITSGRVLTATGPTTVVLKSPLFDTITNAAFFTTTGPLTVRGTLRTNGTFTLVQRAGSETVRVIGQDLPVDAALLTPSANDTFNNTNSGAGPTGAVISDGTSLYSLINTGAATGYRGPAGSVTASGGTTTLTSASPTLTRFSGTPVQTVVLPPSFPTGLNGLIVLAASNTGGLIVNASNGSLVTTVPFGVTAYFIATSITPTAPTDWLPLPLVTVAGAMTLPSKVLSAPKIIQTVNAQTGTSYTLVAADISQLVTMNNASASTLTVPPNSSVGIAVGESIDLYQLGAGQVTITAGAGVTLLGQPGLKIAAQNGWAKLTKIATDTWSVAGDLSA